MTEQQAAAGSDAATTDASASVPISVAVVDDTSLVSSSAADDVVYDQKEKVLTFHSDRWWRSKVIGIVSVSGRQQYHIHFDGFGKKRYDSDHFADDLMKDTPANRAIADQYNHNKDAAMKPKRTARNKRKFEAEEALDETVDVDAATGALSDHPAAASTATSKLVIPGTLKRQLMADWELITRKHHVVPLPRHPNVARVLESFVETTPQTRRAAVSEVCAGLRLYFDRSLPLILLYKYERPQHNMFAAEEGARLNAARSSAASSAVPIIRWSNIYGCEHLLRLFVKLPALLAETIQDNKERKLVVGILTEIIRFIESRRSELFITRHYQPTDQNYTHMFNSL